MKSPGSSYSASSSPSPPPAPSTPPPAPSRIWCRVRFRACRAAAACSGVGGGGGRLPPPPPPPPPPLPPPPPPPPHHSVVPACHIPSSYESRRSPARSSPPYPLRFPAALTNAAAPLEPLIRTVTVAIAAASASSAFSAAVSAASPAAASAAATAIFAASRAWLRTFRAGKRCDGSSSNSTLAMYPRKLDVFPASASISSFAAAGMNATGCTGTLFFFFFFAAEAADAAAAAAAAAEDEEDDDGKAASGPGKARAERSGASSPVATSVRRIPRLNMSEAGP